MAQGLKDIGAAARHRRSVHEVAPSRPWWIAWSASIAPRACPAWLAAWSEACSLLASRHVRAGAERSDRGWHDTRQYPAWMIYAKDFEVAYKGKNNPVTEARRVANGCTSSRSLRKRFPDDGIVAEERRIRARLGKRRCGSRPARRYQGVHRQNGEFSVMIAWPSPARVSWVCVPARQRQAVPRLWSATAPARAGGPDDGVRVSHKADRDAEVVVSRSHRPSSIEQIMQQLGATEEMPMRFGGREGGADRRATRGSVRAFSDKSSLWDACGPGQPQGCRPAASRTWMGRPSARAADMQNRTGHPGGERSDVRARPERRAGRVAGRGLPGAERTRGRRMHLRCPEQSARSLVGCGR